MGGACEGAAVGGPVGAGPKIGFGMASGSLRFSPALCSATCFTCTCSASLLYAVDKHSSTQRVTLACRSYHIPLLSLLAARQPGQGLLSLHWCT